jgi:hypothetical protein
VTPLTVMRPALGLISPQERVVSDVIRRIRNLYAHTLAQIDFSHELIVSELSKVSVNNSLGKGKPKVVFIGMSMVLYVNLFARSTYLAKQRSLAIPMPIYKLAMGKSISAADMIAPNLGSGWIGPCTILQKLGREPGSSDLGNCCARSLFIRTSMILLKGSLALIRLSTSDLTVVSFSNDNQFVVGYCTLIVMV